VNGVSLTAAASIAGVGSGGKLDGGVTDQVLVVEVMSVSASGLCAALMGNTGSAVASSTVLGMMVGSGSGTPVGPGTYTLTGSAETGMALAVLLQSDSTCKSTEVGEATGGTIVVSSVTSTTATGTFNLTFSGGSLTGSFSAPLCGFDTTTGTGAGGDAGPACLQ
jgi:hypothetical protein